MEKGKPGYRYGEAFEREGIGQVIEKHITLSPEANQLGVAEVRLLKWIAKSGMKQHAVEQKPDTQCNLVLERGLKQHMMERDPQKEAVPCSVGVCNTGIRSNYRFELNS